MNKLKLLDWCDRLADGQIENLERQIFNLKKEKARIATVRLEIKQERKDKNDSDSRERSRVTRGATIH